MLDTDSRFRHLIATEMVFYKLLLMHVFYSSLNGNKFWNGSNCLLILKNLYTLLMKSLITFPSEKWFDVSEAVAYRCSVERVFLEISQNSHENACARVSFLIKLQKRLWHRYFHEQKKTKTWAWYFQSQSEYSASDQSELK